MGKTRKDYGLTDETRTVVNGNYADVAEEMGVHPSYIYGIVNNDNPDPFAYFKPFYAGCVRAGVSYEKYDDAMAKIRNRYRTAGKAPCEKAYLLTKVHTDAESTKNLIKAFQDGHLDDKERERLRADVERIRANCDLLDTLLDFHSTDIPKVRQIAREAINKKKVA